MTTNKNPSPQTRRVAIIMGSDSDFEVMQETVKTLKAFEVPFVAQVMSAHRIPEKVSEFAQTARSNGFAVIIAGAGAAAHLAGVIAGHTTLPVIGVPLNATPLAGIDALYSTVQMPAGIPVASMAIGKAGATNAALFAIATLAITDTQLADRLTTYREEMKARVQEKNNLLQAKLPPC